MNTAAIYMCSLHVKKERSISVCKGNLRRQKVTICAKNVIKSWHVKFLPYQENARNNQENVFNNPEVMEAESEVYSVSERQQLLEQPAHQPAGQEEAMVKKKEAVKIPPTEPSSSPPAPWKHFWKIHFAVVWT